MNLDFKQIKKMLFYNYLNDNIPSLIIDCRNNYFDRQNIEGGKIRESYNIDNFKSSNLKNETRLILILDNCEDFNQYSLLEELRNFIKSDDKINQIYIVIDKDYQEFIKSFPFFLINSNTNFLSIQIASTSHPLIILDNLLYIGNFLNSKNLHQLKDLNIKCIISMLNEPDIELDKIFSNYNHFECNEIGHSEIEFDLILDFMINEIQSNNSPILLYCFSGQTISIAICIAFLMKFKKWSLQFAIAYVMKIFPFLKIPSWLYSQLLKLNF
jgi:atypical dual specificity phosphatase